MTGGGGLAAAAPASRNWKTIFYGHYRSIFNRCDIIGLKVGRIRRKKRKIRTITAFKVIEGHRGRYQSKDRMRFPISIVTDILSRTVLELSQLIVQISHQRGHFDSKFQVEGIAPTNHLCTDS